MTLIAHSDLPTFARLAAEGQEILRPDRAKNQDIRELHVGVYNMMPDAALEATERQFLRLIGSSNRIVQFYVHLFSPEHIVRSGKAKQHVAMYYEKFSDFKKHGLDAMIITGANPKLDDLTKEVFWDEFVDMLDWCQESVTSVLCSCFATHAVFKYLYNEDRIKLPQKCWGVYSHTLKNRSHPVVSNMNTKFDAPHSHVYGITSTQAEKHLVKVLAHSDSAGLHLAVTRDFRFVFLQGHPEYDTFSLLKEYKREVENYFLGTIAQYPAIPENYFSDGAIELLNSYTDSLNFAKQNSKAQPKFPEEQLSMYLHNTWVDTGKSIFNNWLGLVYKVTHKERQIRLMDHLDVDNPLDCDF